MTQPSGFAVVSLSDRSDRTKPRLLASRRCHCLQHGCHRPRLRKDKVASSMYQLLASLGARQRVAIALIAAFAAAVFTIQLAGSASAATKHHRGKHRGHVATHTGSATGPRSAQRSAAAQPADARKARSRWTSATRRFACRSIRATRPIPNHPGQTEKVWYVLLDAPIRASRTTSASTTRRSWRTSRSATQRPCRRSPRTTRRLRRIRFGPAVIHFQGAPDFSPTRIAVPGPTGFPLKSFQPGRRCGSRLQPVHQDRGIGRRLQRADHRHR